MQKKRLFQIMARAKTAVLQELAQPIQDRYTVLVVKEPARTLTMIKMREPVKSSLYYIGEVMVTEAIVEINGIQGMAVTMGDDFEKTVSMAILDCGFNNGLPEMGWIEAALKVLEGKQLRKIEQENAMHLKTMVDFHSMDGGDGQ